MDDKIRYDNNSIPVMITLPVQEFKLDNLLSLYIYN